MQCSNSTSGRNWTTKIQKNPIFRFKTENNKKKKNLNQIQVSLSIQTRNFPTDKRIFFSFSDKAKIE